MSSIGDLMLFIERIYYETDRPDIRERADKLLTDFWGKNWEDQKEDAKQLTWRDRPSQI